MQATILIKKYIFWADFWELWVLDRAELDWAENGTAGSSDKVVWVYSQNAELIGRKNMVIVNHYSFAQHWNSQNFHLFNLEQLSGWVSFQNLHHFVAAFAHENMKNKTVIPGKNSHWTSL